MRCVIIQLLFIFGIMFVPSVSAAEITEEHLKAAHKAIKALNVTAQFNVILPNMAEKLKSNLIQVYPNYSDSIAAVVNDQALKLVVRRVDLEKEIENIYAKNFTISELNVISEFYSSEAGKKLLANGPTIITDMMKSADVWAASLSKDISKNTDEALAKIIKDKPIPEDVKKTGIKK
ncbi:hypothetical protein RL73_03770 [Liberibacter crescens]|nr:hypothetical protein RL73_03770 [Liberibacter crescens]